MSNLEASRVYETVVESVVNEVREDFENAGIDEQTLQDLRRVWQSKLSDSGVCKFSWDPEPEQRNITTGLDQQVLKDETGNGLVLPGLTQEEHRQEGVESQEQDGSEAKQEIELTMDDPNGEIAQQLKLQAKQAKKTALLETDEINSDLDDSEDDYLNSSGDEETADENIVLCLYEKVLRVKNKWKCNLKDGIATINHKDYAFQKAQGESEW